MGHLRLLRHLRIVYLRGWRRIRLTRPRKFPPGGWAVLAGLLRLWVAIASPLDAFGNLLLTAHMAQHLVLMSVAPPLILLGAPVVPLLRGLPRWRHPRHARAFFSMEWLEAAGAFLAASRRGMDAFNAAFLGWHVPAAYELALRSAPGMKPSMPASSSRRCFSGSSVLQPWPSKTALVALDRPSLPRLGGHHQYWLPLFSPSAAGSSTPATPRPRVSSASPR